MKPISWFSITWQLASTYRKLYWQSINTDHPSFTKAVFFFSLAHFYISCTYLAYVLVCHPCISDVFVFSIGVYMLVSNSNKWYAFNISLVPNNRLCHCCRATCFFFLLLVDVSLEVPALHVFKITQEHPRIIPGSSQDSWRQHWTILQDGVWK